MTAPAILMLDNVDSFTFMLVDYLRHLGADVMVVRSDAVSVPDALSIGRDGVVISPGPGGPEDAGISVDLARACVERRHPLLGICLGHQALAVACGSSVSRSGPVHGKIATVSHDATGLFQGLASPMPATRYHSLAVPDPRPPLIANAWSSDGVVMGMRHVDAPAHGVQFHPESVASDHGHALLDAFLRIASTNA
ncbi:aminodeoxychorismate/anthranilate synthase component II [Sphingomonas sp. LY29]|uniref:anthranilate synthase component II n=1 Tax=Sphingomonas sp. LY29 TaxID=3095341 RepID=UPI002D79D08D|nr:aminodeoxychorismate/anthranilate synthase component II [Sphingomonas sp. LY29]WRP25939.1 aminodeoxychorismate/anthranilate synthase component II [Sphingomonas sp. LY29]